ncbi:TolC family protein [Adhaeribacter radiodurans]|uniref:TolC family protein n=1 Tax=Adhaeribacter radiodurans TaxID=2745197 RepID=A0A7L7L4H3_9BACT|nr:TolC family protein [Adhaeribacter radiodurans]QMU27712.1 TolC family protein [Adhaeribacter radiodurans]
MKKILVSLLLSSSILLAFGQNNPQPTDWQEKFFKSPEIALPLLIDAAVKYSAQIEKLDAAKQIAYDNIRLSRKQILNGLAVGSGYSYGTMLNTVNGDQQVSQINAFNLPARAQYNSGINLSLSLGQLLGRKYEVHRQELTLKQAEADRKTEEREIRQLVIKTYQEVSLAKVTWEQSVDALQSADINKKLADKKFKLGQIELDELMVVNDFYTKSAMAQEQFKNKYETVYLILEELTGITINDLMNRK